MNENLKSDLEKVMLSYAFEPLENGTLDSLKESLKRVLINKGISPDEFSICIGIREQNLVGYINLYDKEYRLTYVSESVSFEELLDRQE